MSDFKEMVAKDLTDVFINADEFADEHDLNGTVCQAVVQSPTSQERFITGRYYDEYNGISGVEVMVHCRKADMPETPVEGQVFALDGTPFFVNSVADDMGMLSIELHAHER